MYWVELGGMIVLNIAKPPRSCSHRNPLVLFVFVAQVVWKAFWQTWKSVMTDWQFVDTS